MPENTFPGIYVEETLGLGLSVAGGETAVPLFLGDFGDAVESVAPLASWLDFTQLGDTLSASSFAAVMRGYFANGGSRCYLANTAGRSLEDTLAAVEGFSDITILVAPGLWDEGEKQAGEWARALARYAASHRAMAILHADRAHTPAQARAAVDSWVLDSHAAVYYPWVRQQGTGEDTVVPPSGILAGIWARTDRERGVWRAPANVALAGITGLEYKASDQDQSDNMSLNFLREFAGRGTLVWGARTLATGDDTTWRYIPVRRLVDTVSRDVSTALRSAVFSPNTPATWESVRAAVDSYLHALWQKGGLMGNTAAEAYFVQVGKGVTMTQDDVDNGRLIVKVGLAVTRPAEFLILQHTVELAQGQ
ncbi:phage tail sheath family protein [Streptomyces sp. NBC_01244]|uniref:phage tail sheath family protein n=1 Tax=Streptomyces sp. NBC_01244 TaxID=2903797 RepID=UPI002E0EDF5B|nr:phage tail sheath subtilisin-like domain-containing protein [Streptomyces sp. NBC_01244]